MMREPDGDDGFTLVELVVVLVILAVLVGIALLSLHRSGAQSGDDVARSSLTQALAGARSLQATNGHSYRSPSAAVDATALAAEVGSGTFTDGPATSRAVSVWDSDDGNSIVLATVVPPSDYCWIVVDNRSAVGPTEAATGPFVAAAGSAPLSVGTHYGVLDTAADGSTCAASGFGTAPAAGTLTWSSGGSFPPGP